MLNCEFRIMQNSVFDIPNSIFATLFSFYFCVIIWGAPYFVKNPLGREWSYNFHIIYLREILSNLFAFLILWGRSPRPLAGLGTYSSLFSLPLKRENELKIIPLYPLKLEGSLEKK